MEPTNVHCAIPDEAALVIEIGRADRTDDCVRCGVLLHLHDVTGALEHRRLVNIVHNDPDAGLVPEGAHGEEARVDVDVLHLKSEAELVLLLEIKRLQKRNGERVRHC